MAANVWSDAAREASAEARKASENAWHINTKTAHLKAATAHGLAAEKLREGYKQNGIGKEDFEGGISHAEAHDGYQKMHANFAK